MPDPVCRSRRWLLGSALAGAGVGRPARAARRVRFVRPDKRLALETWYPYQLLRATLEAAGGGYEIEARESLTQARAERELADPAGVIDAFVMGHTAERERRLQLTPTPLYRGLFGWRLLLVRADTLPALDGLASLAQLRALRLIQGEDWPDTPILRANGLRVLGGSSQLHRLHEALLAGHADAFPRAVPEAWRELDADPARLAVLPGLALHYRYDLFFFTRPGDTELAQALARGLAVLGRRGQHEALLRSHHGAAVERAALGARRVISLDNPLLSAPLRALPASAWRL